MELSFANHGLKQLCEQEREARRQLGADCSKRLRTRLADLAAAHCVVELVAGRPHPLKGDRAGQFAVDLSGGSRLVFTPDHEPVPTSADGGIDWASVTKVNIVYIGNYHD